MAIQIREPPKEEKPPKEENEMEDEDEDEDEEGGMGPLDKTRQRDGYWAGDDGVYTDPNGTIRTRTTHGFVVHATLAEARAVADAQPQRIARRGRQLNTQVLSLIHI